MLVRTLLFLLSSIVLLASEPGLSAHFTHAAGSRLTTIPFAAFHVPADQSPFPHPAPGPFTAEISGFISVDLRAQHAFTIEHTGQIELLINGKSVLESTNSNLQSTHTSAPVRLNKGTNALLIHYTSPSRAPAAFRLLWSSRNSAVPLPISAAALSHDPSTELTEARSIDRGAFIFELYQCARCHALDQKPEFAFNAPTFAGIGSRLNANYIAGKILNPSADRPSRMPKLLHGPQSEEKARAIAAFLATLTTNIRPTASTAYSTNGATLVSDLSCRSCHTLPTEPVSPGRISLSHVGRKFLPGALAVYLRNPQAHYTGNPMPNFKLTDAEADSIAAFLLAGSSPVSIKPEMKLAEVGKELVQHAGCLNCHSLDLQNKFQVASSTKLFVASSTKGCLATDSPSAPQFSLAATERADLHAFLATEGPPAQSKYMPGEFAVRLVEYLRCNQCHSDHNLPAPLTLGGKLKPEWTTDFIAGKNTLKPRPWLKVRMPAFPAYATNLAVGLAALHGFPAQTPAEHMSPPELLKTGATLVGSTGGFSCVACHAIGENSVQSIVESPGINLAYSGERLLPDYFRRWLMNPIAIDPSTKMPAYFDPEGRSQLTEFFDGDAHKQIDAIWQYIRSLSK